jgi:DNA-binding LacI/PurR family transcriptional regulator
MGIKLNVTKKDIAEYLGISRTAVSLVLNNTPNHTISEKTRQRIWRAAKELGYRETGVPPKLAYINYNRSIDDPRYLMLLRTSEEAASRFDYSLLFMSVRPDPLDHQRLLNVLNSPDIAGLIVTGALDDTIIALIEGSGLPCLFCAVTERDDINKVSFDYSKAAYQATRHLLALGHRRIAFFSGSLSLHIHKVKLGGYRQALQEAGIEFDRSLVQANMEEDGYELCTRAEVIGLEYTAIYCVNTVIQFGALQSLKDRGIQVPGEVSLIGTGSTEMVKASVPPLTTISFKPSALETVVIDWIDLIRSRTADTEADKKQIYIADFEIFQGGTIALNRI